MPIYEYVCSSCGAEFEHLTLSRREPGPDTCPECGASSVDRKVSLSSFALKGGGWYKDGYASKGGNAGSSSSSSSSSGSSSASAGSSTPAPAASSSSSSDSGSSSSAAT